jgi:hypothetical protein
MTRWVTHTNMGIGMGINSYPPVYMGDPMKLSFCREYGYEMTITDAVSPSSWVKGGGPTTLGMGMRWPQRTRSRRPHGSKAEGPRPCRSGPGGFMRGLCGSPGPWLRTSLLTVASKKLSGQLKNMPQTVPMYTSTARP